MEGKLINNLAKFRGWRKLLALSLFWLIVPGSTAILLAGAAATKIIEGKAQKAAIEYL